MKEEGNVKNWEKPELTVISTGGIKENILSGSGVNRERYNPDGSPKG